VKGEKKEEKRRKVRVGINDPRQALTRIKSVRRAVHGKYKSSHGGTEVIIERGEEDLHKKIRHKEHAAV